MSSKKPPRARSFPAYAVLLVVFFSLPTADIVMSLAHVPCDTYRPLNAVLNYAVLPAAAVVLVAFGFRVRQRILQKRYRAIAIEIAALLVPAGGVALLIALTIEKTLFYCVDFSGVNWCAAGLCVH